MQQTGISTLCPLRRARTHEQPGIFYTLQQKQPAAERPRRIEIRGQKWDVPITGQEWSARESDEMGTEGGVRPRDREKQ